MAPETSASGLTGIEKASLLLTSLGTEAASAILQRLSPKQVKALGQAISKLDKIDVAVKEKVLQEFQALHKTGPSITGADYAREILQQALGNEAQDLVAEIITDQSGQPFEWLKNVGTPRLAATLSTERPQVIALVCAYLSANRAADVISQLPEQIQGDVAYRLSYMRPVAPEVSKVVEDVLETRLSREGTAHLRKIGGVNSLVAILNNADRATETKILDYLQKVEAGVAESVREMLFVFDDIAELDDHALQTIIQESEQDDIRLALKGSTQPVRQAFFKNMSERTAEAMKEDIEMMGRVKVRDVEAAQRRVMEVVRRLDEAGTISIRADSEEFVS